MVPYFRQIQKPEEMQGKVVLIQDATSSLGKELAFIYAKRKCKLFLTSESESEMQDLVFDIKLKCLEVEIIPFVADLTKIKCMEAVLKVIESYRQLDMVILAGQDSQEFEVDDNMKLIEKHRLIFKNLQRRINLANFAIPFLRETKGQLMFVNCLMGNNLEQYRNSYYALKSAEDGYFKKLRETESDIFVIQVYTVMNE